MSIKPTLRAGFIRTDITPDYPVSVLGYFNDRISEGVLDRLYLRAATIVLNEKKLLFLQIDNCTIPYDDAETIKNEISKLGKYRKDEILIFAIHTHTGPSLANFYESIREEKYFEFLKSTIISTAAKIEADQEVTVHLAETSYPDLTYNRRSYMKDGSVATNPPKQHPDRVKPEGPVDRKLRLISFHDKAENLLGIFCNISNHTDTVGDNLISADWPGILETEIQNALHSNIPVFTFIAPQGNINHLDFESLEDQFGYPEAQRIGKEYAKHALTALDMSKMIQVEDIDSEILEIDIPPREFTSQQIVEAENILREAQQDDVKDEKLSADDIFAGNMVVKKLFAKNLLDFSANKKDYYTLPLQVVRLGKIIFFAIPGEPFVEIGLELIKTAREQYDYDMTFPIALANGYFGYIPMEENFPRGGYEVSTGIANPLSRTAAQKILDTFTGWMKTHKE